MKLVLFKGSTYHGMTFAHLLKKCGGEPKRQGSTKMAKMRTKTERLGETGEGRFRISRNNCAMSIPYNMVNTLNVSFFQNGCKSPLDFIHIIKKIIFN